MQQTCSHGEEDCFFPVNKDKEKEDKEVEEEEKKRSQLQCNHPQSFTCG